MRDVVDDGARRLVELYDVLLPEVYGYLLDRSGDRGVAEDLTSETFLAVVRAEARPDPAPLSAPWIVGIARHKLADHWRRRGREDRFLAQAEVEAEVDPWDATVDELLTRLDPRSPGSRSSSRVDVSLPRRVARSGGRGAPRAERARDRVTPRPRS